MMSDTLHTDLENFKRCAQEAPAGCYDEAKRLNEVIGDTVESLMRELRGMGLKANNCDLAFGLEAAIYGYVKQSNPAATVFPVAEGFGAGLAGPARDRVLAQAQRDRDFLCAQTH